MRKYDFNYPIFISELPYHADIKTSLLEAIASMGMYSLIDNKGQQISNTDWHLNTNFTRPYWDIAMPYFIEHNEKIRESQEYEKINISNYWFQQYKTGDYHSLHAHGNCSFSNVYFLELPDGASKTCFNINGEEVYFDVKEGDIITFPGIIRHESKPNKSDKRKTVIVYNSTVD